MPLKMKNESAKIATLCIKIATEFEVWRDGLHQFHVNDALVFCHSHISHANKQIWEIWALNAIHWWKYLSTCYMYIWCKSNWKIENIVRFQIIIIIVIIGGYNMRNVKKTMKTFQCSICSYFNIRAKFHQTANVLMRWFHFVCVFDFPCQCDWKLM